MRRQCCPIQIEDTTAHLQTRHLSSFISHCYTTIGRSPEAGRLAVEEHRAGDIDIDRPWFCHS